MQMQTILEDVMEEYEDIDDDMDEDKDDSSNIYNYELPELHDKSKYKRVAMLYCRKMGWKQPEETVQSLPKSGYRATVSMGAMNEIRKMTVDGDRKKRSVYNAYIRLIPLVIPRQAALELAEKYLPLASSVRGRGNKRANKMEKHPKSKMLEWAQKHGIKPPTINFTEIRQNNIILWSAESHFCGKTATAAGANKKESEFKCFKKLLKLGIDVNTINAHKCAKAAPQFSVHDQVQLFD
eukprot:276171_1